MEGCQGPDLGYIPLYYNCDPCSTPIYNILYIFDRAMDLTALCICEGRSELRNDWSCELQDTTFIGTTFQYVVCGTPHLLNDFVDASDLYTYSTIFYMV